MHAPLCYACPLLPHMPPFAMHAPLCHACPDRMTDACENITFQQLLLRAVKISYIQKFLPPPVIQIEENSCPFPGSDVVFSVPPQYSDLTYKLAGDDRPNPRDISNVLLQGPSGLPSYTNKTVLFVFFGKYQVHQLPDRTMWSELEKGKYRRKEFSFCRPLNAVTYFVVTFFCFLIACGQQNVTIFVEQSITFETKKSRHTWCISSTINAVYILCSLASMGRNAMKYVTYHALLRYFKIFKNVSNVTIATMNAITFS